METAIIGCLNVLGEEKVVHLLSKCNFANDLFGEDVTDDEEELIEDDEEEDSVLVE